MLGENLPIWLKLLIQFVNFAILLGVIVKFAGKPLKDYLRKRHDAVKERIDEAERLLKEAGVAKARYEEKLSGLEAEIEAFRTSITEAMEKEKKRILDEAQELAARIREQARLAYEQEMKEAMGKVQAEIAGRTIAAATVRVREMFKQDDHDRMVEEFIQKVRSTN
jgi:F-type H+-transporting ATPase subunit b